MSHSRLPHGYMNATSFSADGVLKRYLGPDSITRYNNERGALHRFCDIIPTPKVLVDHPEGPALELSRLPGRNAAEVILKEPPAAEGVLRQIGGCIRDLQRHPRPPDRPDWVWSHGDFGVNNVLLESGYLTGVLDWEWCQPGPPIKDLAWSEWVIRNWYPRSVEFTGALYEGYGQRFAWSERHASMVDSIGWRLARCENLGIPEAAVPWRNHLANVEHLVE